MIDTAVFAGSSDVEPDVLRRLSELTKAYVVAYDLRAPEERLPLCAVVGQAYIGRDRVAALQAAEREMPPWIALVAYARPAELRHSEELLLQAAAANSSDVGTAGADAVATRERGGKLDG